MHLNSAHFLCFALLSFLTESVSAHPAKVFSHHTPRARCVYFETNNDINSIVAIKIDGATGSLVAGSETETHTGGTGAVAFDAAGQPLAADTLVSQGAVARNAKGDMLFVVNAGDSSFSVLTVSEEDCTVLKPIAGPIAIPSGDFPVAITYSDKLKTACVAMSGARSGISCFKLTTKGGSLEVQALDSTPRPRPSYYPPQSTPPRGPSGTMSALSFDSSSSALYATIKGNPGATPPIPGTILRYPVDKDTNRVGGPETLQTFSPPNTAFIFGFDVVPGSHGGETIAFTDPIFGAGFLGIPDQLQSAGPQVPTGSGFIRTEIPNQVATCWSAFYAPTQTLWVADGARPVLVGLSVDSGAVVTQATMDGAGTTEGSLDLAADSNGGFVYSIGPAAVGGIVVNVWDIRGTAAQGVQRFRVTGTAANARSMGMVAV
ncbi:hypothetical protein EV426DRAFT_29540 [Tirmania nivea]|nr:hypothetical protein EV426DRAFT_29540 [Tirmania nivea]